MEKVTAGLQWKILAMYLDDIVVFTASGHQHLEQLREVLERAIRLIRMTSAPTQ